ncbi:MAG: tyrosine protein phosphatase, partial [Myxococcota bacterium]
MYTPVHWLTGVPSGRLGTMARPRGDDWLTDELLHLKSIQVEHLVCALTTTEMHELGLLDAPRLAAAHGLMFHPMPIIDRHVPDDMRRFDARVVALADALRAGQCVVTHCRQGIGRASLIAAALLVHLGVPHATAWPMIQQARGRPVPDTPSQTITIF